MIWTVSPRFAVTGSTRTVRVPSPGNATLSDRPQLPPLWTFHDPDTPTS